MPNSKDRRSAGPVENLDSSGRNPAIFSARTNDFHTLVESLPQLVWICDTDGKNIFFNRKWVEYTGLTLSESYGDGWVKPFHPDDSRRAWELWQNAVIRNDEYSLECRLRRTDGVYRWYLARGVPQFDSCGSIIRWFGTCTDIHDLKFATAEAERANLAKSRFLAAASHDLRQPVQSLTLMMDIIKMQFADRPDAVEAVEIARVSVSSLNDMLTGILDISRLDAGVVEPAIESVELDELVDRLSREYRPRAANSGLEIRGFRRRLRARTDAILLERILRNLIENALRYTKSGGVLIGLRQRGDKVRIDVIDTGVGIPDEARIEIFDEFRQLDNPARDSSRGLGLGLAIVSRLARLLGVEIEVASRINRGSRFSLLLPLDTSVPMALDAGPALANRGGRILVIEDNAGVRKAYEFMLKAWGYKFLSAESGEDALLQAERQGWRFDVILADHRLGSGMTGIEAVRDRKHLITAVEKLARRG